MSEHEEHGKGGTYSMAGQEYVRDTRYINDRIVADPRDPGEWPV